MDRLARRWTQLRRGVGAHPVLGPAARHLRALLQEVQEDRVTALAAEIAFFTLLSLFPLLLVFAALLGPLDALIGSELATRAEEVVVDALEQVLTEEASGLVDAVQQLFETSSGGLLSVGLVLTLWTSSRAFNAVLNALDVAYDLEERRSWLRTRLLGLGLTLASLVSVVLLLAMVLVGPLLGGGEALADRFGLGDAFVALWRWARLPVIAVVLVSWAATVYHLGPNHPGGRTRWRSDLPGAVVAAGGWALGTAGFRLYVDVAGGGNVALGAVGGVPVAMVWMYVMAIVLLLGAEVNELIGRHRGQGAEVTVGPDAKEPRTGRGSDSGEGGI